MIHTGDCLEVMRGMPADSVDCVVTDPPYGLEFMGKGWDKFGATVEHPDDGEGPWGRTARVRYAAGHSFQAWCTEWGTEALRVTKPGGYLLAFGGGRTHHRLTCGLEDAGWVIRETLVWVYASGFAKSRNVSRDLEQAVPEGARCVCVPRSTQTALGSQDGYRPEHDSDGEPPHLAEGSDLVLAPSRGGVRGRSRGGPHTDDPVLGLEHSPAPASNGHPSTGDSPDPSPLQATGSRVSDSGKSGKPSSTSDSRDGSADGRTPPHIPSTQRSGGDSVAASWSPPRGDAFPYSKCTSCGGWQTAKGWGTALKPAAEYIVMARKPLVGNVAANVAQYGTGAINVDGTRIGTDSITVNGYRSVDDLGLHARGANTMFEPGRQREPTIHSGRWPSSVLLSDPALFDEPNPEVVGSGATVTSVGRDHMLGDPADSGGYSRFFIVPKSSRADREPVVRGESVDYEHSGPRGHTLNGDGTPRSPSLPRVNQHPTVKSLDLMRHLIRLVTPSGGTVLDPFLGSGSTAIACELEGFSWIGIEKEPEYVAIAEARLNGTQRGLGLDVGAPVRKSLTPPRKNPAVMRSDGKRSMYAPARKAGTSLSKPDSIRDAEPAA